MASVVPPSFNRRVPLKRRTDDSLGMSNGHDPAILNGDAGAAAWHSLANESCRNALRVRHCGSKGVDACRCRKELAAKVPLSGPSVAAPLSFSQPIRCIIPVCNRVRQAAYRLKRPLQRGIGWSQIAARSPKMPISVRTTCASGSSVWMYSRLGLAASSLVTSKLSRSC
ncbi:hypothetical protein SAMN05216312_10267 [Cohnella sp. OV330]|nr:hypothetical protein SAMN05216312_10267 [Cohnella sp. OV330]